MCLKAICILCDTIAIEIPSSFDEKRYGTLLHVHCRRCRPSFEIVNYFGPELSGKDLPENAYACLLEADCDQPVPVYYDIGQARRSAKRAEPGDFFVMDLTFRFQHKGGITSVTDMAVVDLDQLEWFVNERAERKREEEAEKNVICIE